jgi:PhoD-like phosphatase
MANLLLGPILRYVGETDATVWVETTSPCEVEILGRRARTFEVFSHHYALLRIDGLEAGTTNPYEVRLDGELVWPFPNSPYPTSTIRTIDRRRPYRLAFGSCRVTRPHTPPYDLPAEESRDAKDVDALRAYALRMATQSPEAWPDLLLWLGDQVYADDVSLSTRRLIRARRDVRVPPGEEVADFEEYAQLYLDAWSGLLVRWLMSTVSSAMIFDDHDVHDDWNTSDVWVSQMRRKPWWRERIVGGFMSYWLYQHLGNLSPAELEADEVFGRITAGEPAEPLVRELAERADREVGSVRWSYFRDLGASRLVVIDSRAGRVLEGSKRLMLDAHDWSYIEEHARGDCDHLLLATSVPFLLAPGLHYLEQWNERVCAGAWGGLAAPVGERIRQGLDLEHWAAFERSFAALAELERSVAEGERGERPASLITLSGDVHHAYLTEVAFPCVEGGRRRVPVYQAVCSPMRNALSDRERRIMRIAQSKPAAAVTRALARSAGARDHRVRWRLLDGEGPWFGNQIGTLELDWTSARVRLESPLPEVDGPPRLRTLTERVLA